MANIGLITASISHPSIAPIQAVFVSGGHTVTLIDEAAVEVPTLLTFDVIVAARFTDTPAAFGKLIAAFDNGIPIMTGSVGGTPTDNTSQNELSAVLGISSGLLVGGTDWSSAFIETNSSGFYDTTGSSLQLYDSNTFTYSFATPLAADAEIIGYIDDGGAFNDTIGIIRCEIGSTTLNGTTTPARFIGNGFLYGLGGFTDVQQTAMLRMITWLTTLPVNFAVSGTVTLDGQPYASRVIVTSVADEPTVLATGVSDNEGNYSISVGDYQGSVMVHTLQDYGIPWPSATALSLGDVVHPTVPNGYVFRVTAVGTTGGTEPAWPVAPNTDVTDGGVTYTSEILLQPEIQGYIQTAEVI